MPPTTRSTQSGTSNLKREAQDDTSIIRAESLITNSHQLHCARCHKTYFERDNVGKVCCIKHEVFNDDPEDAGGDTYRYTCKSCRKVGFEDGAGGEVVWPNRGICFEGKHTTYAAEVFYDGDNTARCEEKGCKVHHCVRCHQTYDEGYKGACGEGEGLVHTTKVEEVVHNGEDIVTCEEFECYDEDEED